MSKIETLREALSDLIALRGLQDQTIRCGVIAILYRVGGKKDGFETKRFLEAEIERMRESVRLAEVEAFDMEND